MKNFSKVIGIAALGAVIIYGLALASCDLLGGETTWTFENHTMYAIQVESKDLDPSYFVLKAYTGNDDQLLLPGEGNNPPVDTAKATSKKSRPKVGWICQNQSQTFSENNVEMKQSGSVIRFTKKQRAVSQT